MSDNSTGLPADSPGLTVAPVIISYCPNCQTSYKISDQNFGHRTVCINCKQTFHMVPVSEAAPTLATGMDADEVAQRVGNLWLDLRKGQIVDNTYEVLGTSGQGGFNQVFKVRHIDRQLDMALKLPKPFILNKVPINALINEAENWLRPALHPNMVSCYHIGQLMKIPAIFLEYVSGVNLSELMVPSADNDGPPRLYRHPQAAENIIDLMIQAAWGLEYAHSLGLLHLDFKPANLLVEENGRLLISDFGMVGKIKQLKTKSEAAPDSTQQLPGRERISATETTLAQTKLMGTPQYFSPEAAGDSSPPTPGFDLWALSLTLLECFIGHRPWESGSMVGHALDNYLKNSNTTLPIPYAVAKFLKKTLHDQESKRFQSAGEAAEELLLIYKGLAKRPYHRSKPVALEDGPDRLNNKAVSFRALGFRERAEQIWRGIIDRAPNHEAARFNLNLFSFRQGYISATDLKRKLDDLVNAANLSANDNGTMPLSAAETYLELGEADEAVKILKKYRGPLVKEAINILDQAALFKRSRGERRHRAAFRLSASPDLATRQQQLRDQAAFVKVVSAAIARNNIKEALAKFQEPGVPPLEDTVLEQWTTLLSRAPRARLVEARESASSLVSEPLTTVKAAGDKKIMLSALQNNQLGLCRDWDSTNRLVTKVPIDCGVSTLALNRKGLMAVIFDANGAMLDFNIESKALRQHCQAHAGPAVNAAFTPNEELLLTTGRDGFLKIWDTPESHLVNSLPRLSFETEFGPLVTLRITPDGQTALAGGSGGLQLFSLEKMEKLGAPQADFSCSGASAVDPYSRFFLAAGEPGQLIYIKIEDQSARLISGLPENRKITAIDLSPDGRFWAVGFEDGGLIVGRPINHDEGFQEIKDLKKQSSSITLIRFAKDYRRLLAVTEAGLLTEWALTFELAPPQEQKWDEDADKILATYLEGNQSIYYMAPNVFHHFKSFMGISGLTGLNEVDMRVKLKEALDKRDAEYGDDE